MFRRGLICLLVFLFGALVALLLNLYATVLPVFEAHKKTSEERDELFAQLVAERAGRLKDREELLNMLATVAERCDEDNRRFASWSTP